jgi:hypothetical protein
MTSDANCHSERHVSLPDHTHKFPLTNDSEHVIIPRTENTIKCMDSSKVLQYGG